MFALTVNTKLKSKKAKFLVLAIACVLVLFIAFICVSSFVYTPPKSIEVEGKGKYTTVVKTDEDAQEFVEQFSYEVEELYSLQEMYVPIEFNEIYAKYNEVQKTQGLDLEPYKGEKCKLYIYKLKDYEVDNAQAYMSVLVLEDRVIGGHISTMIEGCESHTFFGE
ncbi:MAG: DUF4830 domain-containing protein [Ruminococcus sp.]|nr:DUF4830 domain-containing protein [Ruminococcus sp.]